MSIQAYQQVGGYDESFSHNEDAELDARIINHGGKIWQSAETGLSTTLETLFLAYSSNIKAMVQVAVKHYSNTK
ncbi:hypothetical protein JCM19233_2902 [Vibrio astriarenae]|nr:hypothetical protein JCM19233_2902 [Vibrio sp. C7]